MPDPITILDLIRNGTLSAPMAATLWAAVQEGRSFLTVAIPRLAGKTTTANAVLGLLSPQVPVHRLSGDVAEMARLKREAKGGYLVVGEFSQGPVPGYIWGEPVRRVFDTLTAGYSLVTSLHAPGLNEAFHDICAGNGVSDQAASRIGFLLYIRRFGDSPESFWRRVAEIHEIDQVRQGRPEGRLLYRWVEGEDRFEAVEPSRTLQASAHDLAARAAALEALAGAGRTSPPEVARLVASHPGQRPGGPPS